MYESKILIKNVNVSNTVREEKYVFKTYYCEILVDNVGFYNITSLKEYYVFSVKFAYIELRNIKVDNFTVTFFRIRTSTVKIYNSTFTNGLNNEF